MNDRSQTTGYALSLYAGEMITCENGHPFGRVVRDCDAGKGEWIADIDWLQYSPLEGGSMFCNACGARWVFIAHVVGDPSNKRARIHVGEEWRPPLDDRDRRHMTGEEFVDACL